MPKFRLLFATVACCPLQRKNKSGVCAQTEDEEGPGEEKDGGGGEGGLHVKGAPERPHQEAGDEVTHGVDRSERSESHTVLFLGHEFGGKRIFQSLLCADIKPRKYEDHREQPQRMTSRAKKNGGHSRKAVARCENSFAAGDVIAEPAAEIR